MVSDEDSEPILGQLFKEEMSTPEVVPDTPPPPPTPPVREVKHKPARLESREVISVLPDRRDPHGVSSTLQTTRSYLD